MTSTPKGPIIQKVQIENERGLHARASAKFCAVAQSYEALVTVTKDGVEVGGTSIMGLLTLGAGIGSTILIKTDGRQAAEAMDTLIKLVKDRFGEDA